MFKPGDKVKIVNSVICINKYKNRTFTITKVLPCLHMDNNVRYEVAEDAIYYWLEKELELDVAATQQEEAKKLLGLK